VRQFHIDEAKRNAVARPAVRSAPQQSYFYAPSSYAPSRTLSLPFFRSTDDGRLAAPAVNLNPFAKVQGHHPTKRQLAKRHKPVNKVALDTVSGAADAPRSICVRLCDGFHSPIGFLSSQSDLMSHEALCKAMNPGVPVKVYRVAAGATTIDSAVGIDGKTYGSLPMAYAHEKSADPACRPPIVQANERRVSILKDFTLRPGDAVVVNGSARIFTGASSFPFQDSNFRDFRSSGRLTEAERRKIDLTIDHSARSAAAREARRSMRLREASLNLPRTTATDIPLTLRGSFASINDSAHYTDGERGRVRVISPGTFWAAR
jgi:hypothetical protein